MIWLSRISISFVSYHSGNQLKPEFFAGNRGRTGECGQGQAGICRVEQAVQGGPAGVHFPGHRCFGKVLHFHFLMDLPCPGCSAVITRKLH